MSWNSYCEEWSSCSDLSVLKLVFVLRTVCVCCINSVYVHMNICTYVLYVYTVKPVYKDHSRDQVIMVFVDRWSLCRGAIVLF